MGRARWEPATASKHEVTSPAKPTAARLDKPSRKTHKKWGSVGTSQRRRTATNAGHSHKACDSVGGEALPQAAYPDSPLVKKYLCCKANKCTEEVREKRKIKLFINDHVQRA